MRPIYPLLACLGLVAAFPKPKGATPDKNDPELLDITAYPTAFDKKDQKKILKPCTDPLVRSTDQDVKKVWKGLGCEPLNALLNYNYTMAKKNDETKLDYIEFMSNRIHGPPNMRCRDFKNGACEDGDIQCDDTSYSCGHMLLNSYSNVYTMLKGGYDNLKDAHDRVQDDMGSFAENFCPEIDDSFIKDLIPVVFSLAAVGAGALAERIIKPFVSSKNFPHVKDGMILGTAMGTPLALNHVDDAVKDITDINAGLESLLGAVYDAFLTKQEDHIKNIFSGSADSQTALKYVIDQGAFIRYEPSGEWEGIKTDILKLFYGALIPKAWEKAPTLQGSKQDRYSRPFFIKSNNKCGEAGKSHGASEICYEDEAWYMLVARLSNGSPGFGRSRPDWSWDFQPPPGEKFLVSKEGYFGLKAEDMLASAIEGRKKGGGKQYWSPDTKEIVKDKEVQFRGGVREPGFIQMMVCPSWDEAVGKLKKATNSKDGGLSGLLDNKHWPCPE